MSSAASAGAAPFPTRDQSPLLAGFGLPLPMPARIAGEGWSLAADLNWASTTLVQRAGTEALLVDAETRAARVTIGRSLSQRFAVQLQLPYRYTGGGALDGFIDGWHDFFGLPQGARPHLREDRIRIHYLRGEDALVDLDASVSGLADSSVDLGYALISGTSSAAAAWISVKLPTGDARRLTGSGATDVSLVLAGERRLGRRWSTFAQAGVTWLGKGDLLPAQQRDLVWSALAGITWRAWRGLDLQLQIDAHGAAFDATAVDFLSDSVALTVGGSYRCASGWQMELAVSEDIAVETAPDVTIVMGLKRKL